MQFISFVVTWRQLLVYLFTSIIAEIEAFCFVIGEKHAHILVGVVETVVALKIEEASWAAHGAD